MFYFMLCLLILIMIPFIKESIIIVREQEAVIIETLGKYSRTLRSGLYLITPILEVPRPMLQPKNGNDRGKYIYSPRIDLRETKFEYKLTGVNTKDNAVINIKISIFFQIEDAKTAVYSVANLYEAIEKYTKNTAVSMINDLPLDEILGAKDQLYEILCIQASKWGVKVNDIILSDLNLNGY